MIKLYKYVLEQYNEKLLISESISTVDEQISENEFVLKSIHFNDVVYETNKIFVTIENEDYGYWQPTQALVFHKAQQNLTRISEQLKKAILLEIENKRIATDLIYQKMSDEYSSMSIEKM